MTAKKQGKNGSDKASFVVTCNSCGFSAPAANESEGNVIAARHAGSVHSTSSTHFLGTHIFVSPA